MPSLKIIALVLAVALTVVTNGFRSGESITEVEIKGGSAKATSVHSSSWNPEEAFKTTTKTGWHNKANQDHALFP